MRRAHQCAARPNGRWTSQTIPSPSIPRSIPVPIGPADDSRASPAPRRAYTQSVSEQRDLRENPERVEDALVALCLRDELRAEDRVDVDRGEREVVGNRGRIEKERPDGERRDDERGENALSEGVSEERRRPGRPHRISDRLPLRRSGRRTGTGS